MSKFVKLSFIFALIFGISAMAFGQSTVTGAIGGVVTNPNKEVVPNASVTVKNTETNKEDTGTTDEQGRFKVSGLQPGSYSVTINGSGFSPYTKEATVEVGRETTINADLSIGPLSGGTVEITSDAPVINTSQQDFSSNLNQTSINELPINGRRWSDFALLTPGANRDGTFGLISFRGISGLLNNNTIDGGDNNQAFFSEERGRTRINYSISQSAIREFQVNTSNYSAEYGRAAGGVVNAVTKSGTNAFHGGAFYYFRDNKQGARNPLATVSSFNNGVVTINAFKPPDRRQQFGGTIGGPIKKDKVFFFFSYDQQKRNFPGLGIFSNAGYLSTANTSSTGGGLKAPNRQLGDTQINSALSFLTDLTGVVPRRGDQKLFLPKIDWHITDNHTFTATYNRLRWESPAGIQTQATNTRGRASFGDDFVNIDSLNLRLASTISPALLNEARFQYGRDNEFEFSQPPLVGEPKTAFGGTRSPDVFLTGGIEFGTPTFLERPAFPDERRVQFADTVTLTAGNHTFKWGGDFNRAKDLQINLRNEAGAYSYNNINDFIIDYLNFRTPGGLPAPTGTAGVVCSTSTRLAGRCYTSNFNQGFGPSKIEFATKDYNFFVQDDIRVNPRLTLNLGLRYEYEKLPSPLLPNSAVPGTTKLPSDKNNFGPRIGFAYDVRGDGKTSVRGGYGIYYGRIINSTISNALFNTGAPGSQNQVSISASATAGTPPVLISPIFPNVLSSAAAIPPAVQFFADDFQNPLIHQFDLIVEREIARNTVVSAAYIGSQGRHLPYFVDTNFNPPSGERTYTVIGGPFDGVPVNVPSFVGPRKNTAFAAVTEIRSVVASKYNALVLQANRRLTNGLQFQASYTRAQATDNGQGSVTFTNTNDPFNVFDLARENARSNFDTTDKFVVSAVYAPKVSESRSKATRTIINGFTIAPIFQVFSGRPYTGATSGSIPTCSSATASGCNATLFALFPSTPAGGVNGSGGAARFPLLQRNTFRQPKIVNVDLRVSRRFRFTETTSIEVLTEAFNLFNRTQVSNVENNFYNVGGSAAAPTLTFNSGSATRATFGSITEASSTNYRERQVQFAVRFEF